MKHKFILLLVCMNVLLYSCKKGDSPAPDPNSAKTIFNVKYGTDALQNMDVYLPSGRATGTTKVLVMIHGGSWIGGDKNDLNAFVDTMKRRAPDYAIFNINYRLSAAPSNVFPTQENDVKAAMDFIYSKSAEYIISDKYVLIGASAGAHLAMLQGYKYTSPVKPKAIVSFFGPADLKDMYDNPVGGSALLSAGLATSIGFTPATNPAIYTSSSPINFITASSVPTILLHGGLDPLVKPSQSDAVRNKLQSFGIGNQYVFYPTGGHGDWDAATYSDAFIKIQAFLNTYVL
ncbi:MAG: alpha/beta hydrolase fold domain-containing protein [Ferruginibacter sp.]